MKQCRVFSSKCSAQGLCAGCERQKVMHNQGKGVEDDAMQRQREREAIACKRWRHQAIRGLRGCCSAGGLCRRGRLMRCEAVGWGEGAQRDAASGSDRRVSNNPHRRQQQQTTSTLSPPSPTPPTLLALPPAPTHRKPSSASTPTTAAAAAAASREDKWERLWLLLSPTCRCCPPPRPSPLSTNCC